MSDNDNGSKHEIEIRPLGDDWVETRMVYRVKAREEPPYHTRGREALHDIVYFTLSFAANIASNYDGTDALQTALHQLGERIHELSGCTCGETRH